MNKRSQDVFCERALDNKCVVCDKVFNKEDKTKVVSYNEAELKVHAQHVKF